MYWDDREVLSASASIVPPTPRLPAPELLDEELLDEELLDELVEELDELEELELEDDVLDEEDELELLTAPPQAVKAPMLTHNRLALNNANALFPIPGFVMLRTLI